MPTKKITAQRLERTLNFDKSARISGIASDENSLGTLPFLPPSGAIGRDGRGPFTYDIETVISTIRANGADVPVFLDHGMSGKAYGWHDHLADPIPVSDGSWEWPVSYTTEGLELVQGKGYRYNSPTWLFIQDPRVTDRQAGEIVGLLENSLTNLPNQYLRALNSAQAGDYTFEIPTTEIQNEMNKEALLALGLAEDAAPADILTAINSLKATADKTVAIIEAAGATADADAPAVIEAAANSRVTAGVLVTKQAFDEVSSARDIAVSAQKVAEDALVAFKTEQSKQAAVAAVDAAIADARFTPAMREDLIAIATSQGVEMFNSLAAKASKHVIASNSITTPSAADVSFGLTAEQLSICKANGINPEIYAKNLRNA